MIYREHGKFTIVLRDFHNFFKNSGIMAFKNGLRAWRNVSIFKKSRIENYERKK